MNKSKLSIGLSLLALPFLIGCGGSSSPANSVGVTADKSAVEKIGGGY